MPPAPIDLDHLSRYVFGDKALLAEVLGIFRDEAAQISARMTPAMDDDAWRLAAHKLKGAARGIGAFALADAAERAEHAAADERAAALSLIVDLARAAADYAGDVMRDAA